MDINELESILNGYFHWNKARMKCFTGMLLALIKVRTVNLTELACGFSGKALQDSRYKRIKRFFCEFNIDFSTVSSWVIFFFGLSDNPLYLSMDRTNWMWGKRHINVLMLSIVYRGMAIPLLWTLLDKKGCSNTQERIALMQRFIEYFGKGRIAMLLADREFFGGDWFAWLLKEEIPFCIRIRNDTITTSARGKEVDVRVLFRDLKPGEQKCLQEKRKLWKQEVYLAALRLEDGDLLTVASSELLPDPIGIYGRRWEIETLFSCLKGRGFNFEDTHMTRQDRIEKLLVLLTIACCWAHKTGEWRHEQKPIKIKKHGRMAISYFRYGLDVLRDIVLNNTKHAKNFLHTILSFHASPSLEGIT
jgi:hypothetical protein